MGRSDDLESLSNGDDSMSTYSFGLTSLQWKAIFILRGS